MDGPPHRFNNQLPYSDRIPEENKRLLGDITGALGAFNAKKDDIQLLLRACSGLERLRELKYSLDDASCFEIAQSLHDIAFPPSEPVPLPWRCGNKVISALGKLIGKKQCQLALVGKLTLPWRPMLATLNACSTRRLPLSSSSNERYRLGPLLQLIRDARRYWAPGADREIWEEVKQQINHVHSQEAFRALYILCLFMPARPGIYDELLPEWFRLWGQIDHCPSWDGGWLTLLCRARKCASPAVDWTPYMPAIYNLARASIHTPVSMGEAGSVPLQLGRQVAYQFQSIAPIAARSSSVIFGKLGKMLVFLVGRGGPTKMIRMSDVAIVPPAGDDCGSDGVQRMVSPGALQVLSLFRGLRTYVHPSNGGRWSVEIALMMYCVLDSLAARVGTESTLRDAGLSLPGGELSRDDALLLTTGLLPLVLEMIYSKDASVGAIANNCLCNLSTLSPKSVAPAFAELILRALDPVASINHTHQAPAAIRALTAVFRPLMYPRPYLAPYLPVLLELTLPGLDANDVFKTTTTLQFFHLVLCWVPVQGRPVRYSADLLREWTPPPPCWLDIDAPGVPGVSDEDEHLYTACEGLGGVLLEWSVALLDRVFEILRHKDKTSKVKVGDLAIDTMNVAAAMTGLGRGGGGGGKGSSLASLIGGRSSESLLIGLIKIVTLQLFSMSDDEAAKMASAKVLRFVTDRPLPDVGKDVAGILEVVASSFGGKAVSIFFPALTDGLLAPSSPGDSPVLTPGTSTVLLRWRLRLLSGLARGGGPALAPHGSTLRRLIAAGVKHNDKVVRKCSRKLLRKALYGLCEIRLGETRSLPPARWANVDSVLEWRRLCEPVPANEQVTTWAEPSPEGLTLAAELFEDFLVQPMQELSSELKRELAEEDSAAPGVWRERLKTMDYAVRGGVSLLGDRDTPGEDDDPSGEHLRDDVYLFVGSGGLARLLSPAASNKGPRLYGMIAGLRADITRFMKTTLEACAEGKGPTDVKAAKLAVRLSQKIACTRGAKAHHARRQKMALVAFKWQQRDSVAAAAGKARHILSLKAAANGDSAAALNARRAIDMKGTGGGLGYPRAVFISRVCIQHWRRLSIAPKTIAFGVRNAAESGRSTSQAVEHKKEGTQPAPWPAASSVLDRYRALFSALARLSASEYATVRAMAQMGVNRTGSVFPWFAREIVPDLIGRLSSDHDGPDSPGVADEAHQMLTGACYLLHQRRSMNHVVSKWTLVRALLLALCDSQSVLARLPADKQEKAAARVTILFTTYVFSYTGNAILTQEDKAERDALLSGLLDRLEAFSSAAPSAGGGWRYQLMASWCVMHLIRPDGPPAPMAVWRWFARSLSKGGGQPLQRMALGALQRLLASSDPASPAYGEVSELLSSRDFLRSLFLALAYNHKKQATEGGVTGAEQWSLGVNEILQDAGRGDTTELFPRLRFATRSNLFWGRNARLVSAIISAVAEEARADCVGILLEETVAQKSGAAHEDKRSFDCASAEVAAGIMAALMTENTWGGCQQVLLDTVLPFVDKEMDGVSMEGRLDWTDAIRFALDRATPEGAEPLVLRVVRQTTAVLQHGGKGRDDYSVVVKWLSFVGAVLIELSARQQSATRATKIAMDLCPLLVDGLDHPFKACREEIARNLFLVTNVSDAAWAAGMANDVRKSILAEGMMVEEDAGHDKGSGQRDVTSGIATLSVTDTVDEAVEEDSDLLAKAMVMSDGAPTEEQEASAAQAAKRLSLRRESVLQWLHQMVSAGDHVRYLPILVALLPVALQCVRDSNVQVATMGRGACLSGAATLTIRNLSDTTDSNAADSATVDGILSAVISAASTPSSWRVRRNAAAVACVMQTRLHFVLTPAQHGVLDATTLSLLGDSRREVQETARLAVSTRVTLLTARETRVLCEKFAVGADRVADGRKKRRKLAKRQPAAAEATKEPSDAMREQQVNVLGLSAIVLAAPCDVPSWVPGALESLSRHVHDESPGRLTVRQTVTHTFKEFRRTHQDKWEESHKSHFSREQLDTFDDVLGGAHSYFI